MTSVPDTLWRPWRWQKWLHILRQTVNAWLDDRAATMGAALSYYTVFSMAPLLLVVISVAGLVFGEQAARGEMFAQLQSLLGASGASAVEGMLQAVHQPKQGVWATLTGLAFMLLGATTVFAELQDSLDRIWRAPKRTTSGLWAWLRARLLSFGLILGIGFLLMVSLAMSAVLSILQNLWAPALAGWATLYQIINIVSGLTLTTLMFALIYKIIPSVKIAWSDVWVGAFVTALLFVLGRSLISLYIGQSGVASGFGAAGSLVVILVWVYYSAQIFFLGAEFTWVYSHHWGSLKDSPADGLDRPATAAA